MAPDPGTRSRNADRTRSAILSAATELFAEHGFDQVTLQQVADAAGVARATPSYFFGSKDGLWKAVLGAQSALAAGIFPRAVERLGGRPEPDALISELVDLVLGFQAAHPEFFRLLQWSHLQRNSLIHDTTEHGEAVAKALQAVGAVLTNATAVAYDPRQLLLSVVSLCAAHLTFGVTLGPPMGLDTTSDAFLEARRTHLKRLLWAALSG